MKQSSLILSVLTMMLGHAAEGRTARHGPHSDQLMDLMTDMAFANEANGALDVPYHYERHPVAHHFSFHNDIMANKEEDEDEN